MAKKFSELRAKMAPEPRARASERTQQMLKAMPLAHLRRARGLSQQMLAELLHVNQPAIAKIEKRSDLYVSTVRSHIEAMGGELLMVARFPDGEVLIESFSKLQDDAAVEHNEPATVIVAGEQAAIPLTAAQA